jgi:hypothetical protein
MTRGLRAICLGLFILFLSWIVWKAAGSFVGWLILFLPGAAYILIGAAWTVEDE